MKWNPSVFRSVQTIFQIAGKCALAPCLGCERFYSETGRSLF